MATYIEGTNIPVSAIAGNIKGDAAYWADRLRGAENPNDVLFSMAYSTPFAGQTLLPGQDVWQGQGQGNPNVGALQSNIWSLTGDQPSWAEQAVQNQGGQSDIYQDRSDPNNVTAVAGIDYGQPASADDMARAGTNLAGQSHFFYGTNMPTTGFTATQINDLNNRLRTEIDSKNWKGANDAMFDIAWNMGKNFYGSPTDDQGGYGQGNKFVGMLQSDMFSLTDPAASMWGEDYINSANDEYTLRDLSGNPRGETIRYDDTAGSYIDAGGPPNPAVPSFGFAGYQDWEPFMPTDFPLAAASGGRPAGWRYQPWVNEGTGNNIWSTGTPTDLLSDGPGPINPNIWGNTDTTGSSNITTDTSGNQWVMSPGGRWYPATSDYGQGLLGNSRLFYDQHYDSSGAYVGAEGDDVRAGGPIGGWGGGAYSPTEIFTGIANPAAFPGSGNRQVGLNVLGPTMFRDNYRSVDVTPVANMGIGDIWGGIDRDTGYGYGGTDLGYGYDGT
jgi:hypothetical protein